MFNTFIKSKTTCQQTSHAKLAGTCGSKLADGLLIYAQHEWEEHDESPNAKKREIGFRKILSGRSLKKCFGSSFSTM
jgi:hypothetical protein